MHLYKNFTIVKQTPNYQEQFMQDLKACTDWDEEWKNNIPGVKHVRELVRTIIYLMF